MKKKVIHVLLLEDNPGDVRLFREFFREDALAEIELDQVERLKTGLEHLARAKPDVILLDLGLPDSQGLETFARVFAQAPEVPIVVLTGLNDAEQAVEAVTAGAQDYLVKGDVSGGLLVRAIRYAIERKRTEESLRESEERFHSLYANVTVGIYRTTPGGQILMANPSMVRMLGFDSFDQLAQRNLAQEGHEADYPRIQFLEAMEKQDEIIGFESAWTKRDGTKLFVRESARAIRDARGRIQYYDGTVEDITERKKTEDALAASEAELRALFAGMTDAVIVYDSDGRYIKIAPTSTSNLYRPLENMLGKTVHEILQKEIADYIVGKIRAALQSGETVYGEYSLQINGNEIWFASSASRLSENTVIWVAHDITNRKQVEEEVRYRLNELEMLYITSQAIGKLLRPKEIGQKIIDILSDRLPWHHATLRQYHPGTETLELLAFHQSGLETEAERLAAEERYNTLVTRPGQGFAGWVIQHGQIIYCGDVTKDARYIEVWPTIRSGMYVPLKIGERTIGCLSIESERVNAFTETDEWLITTLAAQAASALENARLFEETRQRLAESEAVNTISIALRTAESLDNMLSAFLGETLALLGTEAGAILLYDADSEELLQSVSSGWLSQLPKAAVKPGEGLMGTAFASGKSQVSHEFFHDLSVLDANLNQIPSGWGGICVPIRSALTVVGVMLVSVQLPREITTGEIQVLNTLAEIVGIAIQRMRLHEQTEQQLQHVQALHEIDTAISARFDLSLTLDTFLKNVLAQLRVDAASILLLNPLTGMLDYTAGKGFRMSGIEQLHLRPGEGYAGRVMLERNIIYMADLPADDTSSDTIKMIENEGFVSYYGVPLIVKGAVIGVLEIFHRNPLKPNTEWLDFLETLAGQATIAIDSNLTYNNLQRSNLELSVAYDRTLEGWSHAIDMRDKETEGHSERVTAMTMQLARVLAVRDEDMEHIRRGALLHDIGKIGIPDSILLKPGLLTAEEWVVMRTHPVRAYELLMPIPYLRPALEIPYYHHENWDGSGYPRGVIGEEIPLAARIFAIVDVYDALMSDRPYRPAWPEAQVLEHLKAESGRHFDPEVVNAFFKMKGIG